VRASAASILSLASKSFRIDLVINKLLPCVQNLVTDPSEHVRISLASSVSQLSATLGKAATIEHLLPLLLLLLRDEASEVM
jgi:serine/threonine-protein phosphatase 2A regulatory subunit A